MSHTQLKDPELEMAKIKLLWPLAYPKYANDKFLTKFIELLSTDDCIQTGQLLEKAISVQCNLIRESTQGRDFANGDDAKLISVRTYGYGCSYGAPIHNIHAKKGCLLVACYERKQQNWFYFRIPYYAYSNIPKSSNIEIPFEIDGTPRIKNKSTINWWKFQVKCFNDLVV